jgi:hypothetical protein
MADADLTLVILDLSQPLDPMDTELISQARRQGRCLLVGNKSDLGRRLEISAEMTEVSALTGAGVEALRRRLVGALAPDVVLEQEGGFITSIRHEQLLRDSLEALEQSTVAVGQGLPHEMLLLTPRFGPSTQSPAPRPPTTFSTGSSRRFVSGSNRYPVRYTHTSPWPRAGTAGFRYRKEKTNGTDD